MIKKQLLFLPPTHSYILIHHTLTLDLPNTDVYFTTGLAGAGSVVKTGAFKLNLSGASSLTAASTVSVTAGTLNLLADGTLGIAANPQVGVELTPSTGVFSPTPDAIGYAWSAGSSASGPFSPIAGADRSTFTPVTAGSWLAFTVTTSLFGYETTSWTVVAPAALTCATSALPGPTGLSVVLVVETV